MREDLRRLLELQNLDNRIAETRSEMEALRRGGELLEGKVRSAQEASERQKQECQKGQVKLKEMELAAAEKRGKIEKIRQGSLAIRNNRDYQAAMHEIAGFDSDIRLIEDGMLASMEEIETEKANLSRLDSEVASARAKLEKEKVEIAREIEALSGVLDGLIRERAARAVEIEAPLLAVYERIFEGRRGRAVVPVLDGSCQGCYMQITPQKANDVHKDDRIYICDNCGRFLFHQDP